MGRSANIFGIAVALVVEADKVRSNGYSLAADDGVFPAVTEIIIVDDSTII